MSSDLQMSLGKTSGRENSCLFVSRDLLTFFSYATKASYSQ